MFFNSFVYFFFLAIVYLLYWQAPIRFRRWILLLASFVFYAYWSRIFFVHFLLVVLVNYALFVQIRRALLLRKQGMARRFLYVALALNLCNLAFFKYAHAFLEFLGPGLGSAYFAEKYYEVKIVLPLAISFYSFQILALHIDAYRGDLRLEEKIPLKDYLLFIFFFPQLIAGPIMRHSDFFYQIDRARLTERKAFSGLFLICFGLVKKSYVADGIASVIDPIFANPVKYDSLSNLLAAVGFALQLYFDFSGYTDMARGSAYLLGYRIPENFRGPYFSASFSEHWRRWHITLSSWLRDYLYIPLGGSRQGKLRTYFNLFLTMGLGGLWHGHNFTYLAWGMCEGFFLVLERILGWHKRALSGRALRFVAVLLVFSGSVFARIFFRADDMAHAGEMIFGIFGFFEAAKKAEGLSALGRLLVLGFALHALQYFRGFWKPRLLRWRYLALPGLSLLTLFLLSRIEHAGAAFIYFQF